MHQWRECTTRAPDPACVRKMKTSWLPHPRMAGQYPYTILLVRSTFRNLRMLQHRKGLIEPPRFARRNLPPSHRPSVYCLKTAWKAIVRSNRGADQHLGGEPQSAPCGLWGFYAGRVDQISGVNHLFYTRDACYRL